VAASIPNGFDDAKVRSIFRRPEYRFVMSLMLWTDAIPCGQSLVHFLASFGDKSLKQYDRAKIERNNINYLVKAGIWSKHKVPLVLWEPSLQPFGEFAHGVPLWLKLKKALAAIQERIAAAKEYKDGGSISEVSLFLPQLRAPQFQDAVPDGPFGRVIQFCEVYSGNEGAILSDEVLPMKDISARKRASAIEEFASKTPEGDPTLFACDPLVGAVYHFELMLQLSRQRDLVQVVDHLLNVEFLWCAQFANKDDLKQAIHARQEKLRHGLWVGSHTVKGIDLGRWRVDESRHLHSRSFPLSSHRVAIW